MNPVGDVPAEELERVADREEDFIMGYLAGLKVIGGEAMTCSLHGYFEGIFCDDCYETHDEVTAVEWEFDE